LHPAHVANKTTFAIKAAMNNFEVDLNGLKRLGKEFLDALPTATIEEADNGFKCFTLAYLNGKFDERELLQAEILLQIMSRKFIQREIELGADE